MTVKMKVRLHTSKELTAMLKALRKTKVFDIVRDNYAGTCVVNHVPTGQEVLRTLKGSNGVWIARIAENLFQ